MWCWLFAVAQPCQTLWDPMDCSMPRSSILHYLPSLLKFMFFELVLLSNSLILCLALLLLPSIFPSIRVFPNESAPHIRWLKYWHCSINPSSEHSGLISFRIDWFDLCSPEDSQRVFSSATVWKQQFFDAQPSLRSNSHICKWPLKNHSFD